jgi:hypothetical protein
MWAGAGGEGSGTARVGSGTGTGARVGAGAVAIGGVTIGGDTIAGGVAWSGASAGGGAGGGAQAVVEPRQRRDLARAQDLAGGRLVDGDLDRGRPDRRRLGAGAVGTGEHHGGEQPERQDGRYAAQRPPPVAHARTAAGGVERTVPRAASGSPTVRGPSPRRAAIRSSTSQVTDISEVPP